MDIGQGRTIAASAGMLLGLAAAVVAAPATAAPKAKPKPRPAKVAIAVGRSDDGRASFRLEGTRLAVTLHGRRLAPRDFAGRPSVRLLCGENIADSASPRSWLVVRAGRDLRVHPGVRRIRATLGAEVARQTNWCRMLYRTAGRTTRITATMALARGTRPGCDEAAGGTALAESEVAKLVRFRRGDDYDWSAAVRACWKATGEWRQLATWSGGKYGGTAVATGLGGRWAAWGEWDSRSSVCSAVQRIDLATGETTALPTLATGSAGPPCVRDVAVAEDGRVAWAQDETRDDLPWLRIVALTPAGQPVSLVELRTYGYGSDLAFSADGGTVTWTEDSVPRSAQMP